MKQLLSILTMLYFGILSAQTYHIGDVYTAPDGSQGIVYYLHPDGSGGWVVALTDASTGCEWGASTDVPGLSNQNSSYSQNLLNDTAGYANTQTLRSYQNNSTTYAAGKVDFAHGWVLPSPAQISMLYGQQPFIASAITGAGGTALAFMNYWCSAEKDASNAWLISFASGSFSSNTKTTSCYVRAVRSFTYTTVVHDSTLTYLWNTGSTQPYIEVSPSQTTTYTVTATTEFGCSNTAEQTIIVGTGTDQTIYDTVCQGSDYESNGFSLTAAETSAPGVLTRSHTLSNSNCSSTVELQLVVKAKKETYISDIACDNYNWNGVTYYESGDYVQIFTAANGCDSIVTLHLTVVTSQELNHTPDNVDSADCTFLPEGTEWGIQVDWSSDPIVSNSVIPLVGDLDGDGHPEVVCFALDGQNFHSSLGDTVNKMLVFDGVTKQLKATITLESAVSGYNAGGYGLVRTSEGKGLIVAACFDNKLRAYDITSPTPGTPYWVSNVDYGSATSDFATNVGFADFNGDGHPEVYLRNKIYNAETGVLLATANGQNTGSSYAHWSHFTHHEFSSPCAANVCGGSALELILGNEVYSVNINNLNGQAGNSITLAKQIDPPGGANADGHAQVADFNADGYLDIFVSVRSTYSQFGTVYCYVWDIHNDIVSNPLSIPTTWSGKSFATIADIDNDGLMEIILQCGVQGTNIRIRAYKYDPTTMTFSTMWGMEPDEDSFSNAVTAFDFNQDGVLELLVCDQSRVRIVNGSGTSHITHQDTISVYAMNTFPFSEITIMQYPVIADVDADGSAEFVSVGSNRLNFFKSSAAPWAPARKVWNQYMYNVTNVNEDLTIPQYLFNNATVFTDPQGVVRRPFNNFLQQATTIDQYGRPFYAVPDVAVEPSASSQVVGDSLVLTFSYCNLGDNTLNAPYPVTVFANAYGGDTLCTAMIEDDLSVDSCTQGEIWLPVSVLCGIPNLDSFVIAVNGNIGGIAQNGGLQPECDTTNNTVAVASSLHPDTTRFTATACDSYLWFGDTLTQSGEYTHTLTNAAGCDSLVILQLVVTPSVAELVEATACDSYLWFGDTLTQSGEYTHTLTNSAGCDSVVTLTLNILPKPAARITGPATICDGNAVTLCADSAVSYLWNTGETTRCVTVDEPGMFSVTVADSNGCTNTASKQVDSLGNPIVQVSIPEMCAGGTYPVSVGYHSDNNIQLSHGETTLFLIDTVFLPDGVYCEPYGCSYRSPLNFTAYADDAVIQSVEDIYYVKLNIEHTFIGDLYINITCPNGQKADLLKYGGTGTSNCNSSISSSSRGWQSGSNASRGTDFGQAGSGSSSSCNNPSLPGIGWNYCWSENTTQDYTYAPGDGSLLYRVDNVHNNRVDSSNVAAGTNFYHPDDSFTNLIGCPLNGEWYIEVQDGWSGDDGYLFGWELALSSEALSQASFEFDYADAEGPWLSVVNDSLFVLNPPADLAQDTVIAYTFHISDSTGCTFDTTMNLTFYAIRHTDIDTTVCESFTWNDSLYTTSGQYVQTFTSAVGCDSIVTVNLIVNHKTYGDTTVVACESFTWHGVEYTETPAVAPTDTITGGNHNGCDSIVTLHLTIHYGTHNVTNATACESYEWHGETYTLSDTYIYAYTNEFDCLSADTLHLTVNYATESTLQETVVENNLPYILNDSTYTLTGTYYQHFANAAGCDSTLTLQLTVYYNQTVETDSTVCENLLPLTWNDSVFSSAGTKTRIFPAANGADSIVVMTLHVNPLPVAAISGLTALCADSVVTLAADSAYSYLWSTGDTTRLITVAEEGAYSLTVTNQFGCEAVATHYLSALGNPILSVTAPEMCAGGSYTLSVGHQPYDNIQLGQGETTLSMTDTIFLPDGIYCEPYGCSYRSPLTFTAYNPGDTIQSADDIYYVRLNIEHSWIGDLYINITCPNGQKADLLKYGGLGTSECNQQIVASSRGWASGTNMAYSNYLGDAHDYDGNSCDASVFGNEPGIGWNYCWSDNTTQGYTYAPGAGSLIYRAENAHNGIVDSSNAAAGAHFYHPDDPFTNLIGCPLNGDWFIEVQDGWNMDNGYIFGWELALSSEALPDMDYVFDYSTADGPWLTTLSDSLFQIDPPADLEHDTTVAYTFAIYDTTGCGYDTTVFITFYATRHTDIDTSVCESFTWNDSVYTLNGQYVQTFTSAVGCDSIVTVNLIVNTKTYGDTTAVACESFTWRGVEYTATPTVAPTYTMIGGNHNGCDSIVTLHLTVNHKTYGDTTAVACESFTWHGASYTTTPATAPTYTITGGNHNGCDSIVTLHLTVNHKTYGDTTAVACESFTWHGVTYTETPAADPTYTMIGGNHSGCDSTVTLHLTVHHGTHNVSETTSCESYEWHGTTYTVSGTYTYAYSNENGCASVDTLHLTVHYGTHNVIDTTVCERYEWHGETYTETDTYTYLYTNADDCPSADTLHLTVSQAYEFNFEDVICEGDAYYEHGFVVLPTQTIGETEIDLTHALQSVHGCDSVVRLTLTVIDTAIRIIPLTADFCDNMSMELTVETGMPDYVWSTGEDAPTITVTAPGYYSVTATEGGCTVTARYHVDKCEYELVLPNAITPSNLDGVNDYFSLPESFLGEIALFEIAIFNRWGEMVYYSTNKGFRWNGEYRGEIQYQTIYNYVIKYTDTAGRQYQRVGSITVL